MEWMKGYVIVPWNTIRGLSKPPIKERFLRYTRRYALVERHHKGLVGNYRSCTAAAREAAIRYAREMHNYHVDPKKWRPSAIELASRFYPAEELACMSDKALGELIHNTDWHQKWREQRSSVKTT